MKNFIYVKYLLLLLLSLFVFVSELINAQTGKISGQVMDDRNSDPLPGVSVYIADFNRGAITDANGEYTIASVTLGTYSLRFSTVGYQTVVVEDVDICVFTNQTTEIDANLLDIVVESEELKVKAERPIVQKDRTSSVSYLRKETIKNFWYLKKYTVNFPLFVITHIQFKQQQKNNDT